MTTELALKNMLPWFGFVAFIFLCVLAGYRVPEKYKFWIPKIMLGALTFLAAFRYGIALDYFNYIKLFQSIEWNSSIEPTFRLITLLLRSFGFEAQSLFVVYSIAAAYFLWRAMRYYYKTAEQMIFAMALFALFGDGGWWFSLIYIRQWLSITIFIWASRYIVEGKLVKYILAVLLMVTVHYSACILIFAYLFRFIHIKRKVLLALLMGTALIAYMNFLPYVMETFMRYFGFTKYLGYFEWGASDLGSGVGILLMLLIWGTILYFRNMEDMSQLVLSNLYLFGIMLAILSYTSGPLFRMRSYFQFFGFLTLPFISVKMKGYKMIFVSLTLILYACMFLGHAYRVQFVPDTNEANVKYEFNFKLLR